MIWMMYTPTWILTVPRFDLMLFVVSLGSQFEVPACFVHLLFASLCALLGWNFSRHQVCAERSMDVLQENGWRNDHVLHSLVSELEVHWSCIYHLLCYVSVHRKVWWLVRSVFFQHFCSVTFFGGISYLWHAWCEPSDINNPYIDSGEKRKCLFFSFLREKKKKTVTIVKGKDNIFNEDFHVVHHTKPSAHWVNERKKERKKSRVSFLLCFADRVSNILSGQREGIRG